MSIAIIAAVILIISIFPIIIATPGPCTVSGFIYYDDVITEPEKVTIVFPEQEIMAMLFGTGFLHNRFS